MKTRLTIKAVEAAHANALRALKATPEDQRKRVKICRSEGMFLNVTPTGKAHWHLKYRFGGVEREISLKVPFPGTNSLARAHQLRDEARDLIAQGIDPQAERREQVEDAASTVMAVAKAWLATKGDVGEGTITANTRRLEKYVFSKIGTRPIREVKPLELLSVLKAISDGEHGAETARRVCSLCSQVWQFAVLHEQAEFNIAAGLNKALARVRVKHFAAITEPRKFGQLLRAIRGYNGQPLTRLALELVALTFVRSSELRLARWAEFQIEDEEPTWRVPGARTKMRTDLIVPLSKQAVAVLHEIELHSRDCEYLFPSIRGGKTADGRLRVQSENTGAAALRTMGIAADEHSLHGFRASASTMLNELGFDKDAIELQLGHQERDGVRRSYNHATKLAERRRMMQAYADYLDALRTDIKLAAHTGSKVVPIGRKRA